MCVPMCACVCTRGGRCEEWRRRVKANVCCGKSKSPQRPLHCERNSLGEKMDAVFLFPPRCHKLPGHWSMGVWDSREDLALYIYLAQSLQLSPEHKVVSWLPGLLLGYSAGLKRGADAPRCFGILASVRCPAVLTKYDCSQCSLSDTTPSNGPASAGVIFLRDCRRFQSIIKVQMEVESAVQGESILAQRRAKVFECHVRRKCGWIIKSLWRRERKIGQ